MKTILESAKPVLSGNAAGKTLLSNDSLSFWGGVDAHTGCVIDARHDRYGECMSGKVLCIPRGRGSCSSSGIMLEMIRAKTAPAALIGIDIEPVLSLGSVIGSEVYGRYIPMYTVSEEDYAKLKDDTDVVIENDTVTLG